MKIRVYHISEPVCFLILILFPLIFDLLSIFTKSILVGIEFWLIGILSIIIIMSENRRGRPFSTYMLSGFFVYIFVFIAGGYQYLFNEFIYNVRVLDEEVLIANLIIVLWLAISIFTVRSSVRVQRQSIFNETVNLFIPNYAKLILIFLCFAFGIINLMQYGVESLFNRYYFNGVVSTGSQSLNSIIKIMRSGLGMWTLYICAIDYKKHGSRSYLLLSLLSCLILIPPLATSRTIVLLTYGGFLLIVSDRIKKGMNFFLFILILDLFAAPIFNLFRNGFSGNSAMLISTIQDYKDDFFRSDYDAYTMFLLTIRYVSMHGITWGKQLLSVLLFFLPRALWPNKAIGSGATVMGALKTASVSNISCPIFAEAYINFGIIGVIVFSFGIHSIIKKIDGMYWSNDNGNNSLISNLYPFMVLFILMLFRGDLLNAFSWLIGYIIVLLAIRLFFLRKVVM